MSSTSTSPTELGASTCKDIPRRRRSRHRSRSTCSTDSKDTPVSFQQKSEHNFQTWNENLTIIPSVFRHDSEGIPIGTQDKGGQAALKGPQKEKDFLDKMKEFGVECIQHPFLLLVFWLLRWQELNFRTSHLPLKRKHIMTN
eukprot:TCONS_00001374-protein